MEFADCVLNSRAVRSFQDTPVPEGDIEFMIDMARRSGSGKNRQPWSFIVVSDRDRLNDLADLGDYTSPLRAAPIGIVILVDRREEDTPLDFNVFDCGRAGQNLMLAATATGLGTVPQSIRDRSAASDLLNVPERKEVLLTVAVGVPSEDQVETIEGADRADVLLELERRPLENVLHWERHR